jgi:hypothetical protein
MIKYKLDEEQLRTLYHYNKQNRFDIKDFIRYYKANNNHATNVIIEEVLQNYSDNVTVSFKQLCKRDILDKESWKSLKPRGVVVQLNNRRFMYFINRYDLVFDDLGILEVFETTEYTKPKKRYYKTSTPF